MKRAALLCLLFACGEPQRLPVDAGDPDDAGPGSDATPADDAGAPKDAGPSPDAGRGDTGVIPTGICAERPCLTAISTANEWTFLSGPARTPSRCDLTEEILFLIPRSAGTAIAEPLYVDALAFDSLYPFLATYFADEISDLDPGVFHDRFERGDMREYWTGRIFRTAEDAYAFDLIADFLFASPPDAPELEEIRTRLAQSFAFPLAYAPQDASAISRAEIFVSPPFEVLLPEPCASAGEGCTDPNDACVIIPEGTELCGHFAEGRAVDEETSAKLRLQVVPGSFELPSAAGTTPMRLFAGGVFGTARTPIDASAEGLLTAEEIGGDLYYSFAQTVTAGVESIELTWSFYNFRNPQIYREPYLSEGGVYGIRNGQPFPDGQVIASSCTASGLHQYFAEAQLFDGDWIRFSYRHRVPAGGSGPLLLTGGEVSLGGNHMVIDDYFQLIYTGQHHNFDNQFVLLFDRPIIYGGAEVHGVWIDEPGTTCCPVDGIFTVDADLKRLGSLEVLSYLRAPKLF